MMMMMNSGLPEANWNSSSQMLIETMVAPALHLVLHVKKTCPIFESLKIPCF
jgi:hypothetical protein